MRTWNELMQRKATEEQRLIIQLLATATTHPAYSNMTPDEVYDLHVERTKEVMVCDRKVLGEMQHLGL